LGLSFTHLLLIAIVLLLLFGPSRLPGLGKGIGEAIRGFKKGLHGDDEIDVTHSLEAPRRGENLGEAPPRETESSKDKTRSTRE
jgi:sec-independent protein translocase protein TatA